MIYRPESVFELEKLRDRHIREDFIIRDYMATNLIPGAYSGVALGEVYCYTNEEKKLALYYVEVDSEEGRIKVGFSNYCSFFPILFVSKISIKFTVIKFKGNYYTFLDIEDKVRIYPSGCKSIEWRLSIKEGDIIRHDNTRYLCLVNKIVYEEPYFKITLTSTLGYTYIKYIFVDKEKLNRNLDSNNTLEQLKVFYIKESLFDSLPKLPKDYPLSFIPLKYHKIKDLPLEKWFDVPGFEKLYAVSNYGRIKSFNYDGFIFNEGLLSANSWEGNRLYKGGEVTNFGINELLTFIVDQIERPFILSDTNQALLILTYEKLLFKGKDLFWFNYSFEEINECFFLSESFAKIAIEILLNNNFIFVEIEKSKYSESSCYLYRKSEPTEERLDY